MIIRKIDTHASALLYFYDLDLHPGTVSHPKRLYTISSIDREV